MGSILRNNRRMFWEILNRIIGRKNRIIGTGLLLSPKIQIPTESTRRGHDITIRDFN